MAKANSYALDRNSYGMVHSTWGLAVALFSLWVAMMPKLWRWSHWSDNEVLHSLGFALLSVLLDLGLSLPWDWWETFEVEGSHGFNKTTPRLFFVDKLKSLTLMAAIGGPLLSCVIWIVRYAGSGFVIYLYVFVAVVQLLLFLVLADPIMRWFNSYKPLPDGSLQVCVLIGRYRLLSLLYCQTAVQDLCHRVQYDIKETYVVDGSTRSSHSNAYFMSLLWVKKLVLYDTLLTDKEGAPVPENDVMAIVAHELSHWRCGHTLKLLALQLVLMFFQFQLLGFCLFNTALFREFGFVREMPVVIGLALFAKLIAPVDFFLEIGINMISRRFEFEADQGAVDLGYANLSSALIRVHLDNKASVHGDWLHNACTSSHPSLLERIEAVAQIAKRKPLI